MLGSNLYHVYNNHHFVEFRGASEHGVSVPVPEICCPWERLQQLESIPQQSNHVLYICVAIMAIAWDYGGARL